MAMISRNKTGAVYCCLVCVCVLIVSLVVWFSDGPCSVKHDVHLCQQTVSM